MRMPSSPRDRGKSPAHEEIKKDQLKQMPIRIDLTLKKKFSLCASHNNTSMNAILTQAAERYVAEHYEAAVAAIERASKVR